MDAKRQKRRAFWQLFGIFFLLIAFVLTILSGTLA